LSANPRRREGVISQSADGEAVVLDIESGNYFALNAVGTRIWELCDGNRPTCDILSAICKEFDVSEDVARNDTIDLIEQLERERLVVLE